eukprot:690963_1
MSIQEQLNLHSWIQINATETANTLLYRQNYKAIPFIKSISDEATNNKFLDLISRCIPFVECTDLNTNRKVTLTYTIHEINKCNWKERNLTNVIASGKSVFIIVNIDTANELYHFVKVDRVLIGRLILSDSARTYATQLTFDSLQHVVFMGTIENVVATPHSYIDLFNYNDFCANSDLFNIYGRGWHSLLQYKTKLIIHNLVSMHLFDCQTEPSLMQKLETKTQKPNAKKPKLSVNSNKKDEEEDDDDIQDMKNDDYTQTVCWNDTKMKLIKNKETEWLVHPCFMQILINPSNQLLYVLRILTLTIGMIEEHLKTKKRLLDGSCIYSKEEILQMNFTGGPVSKLCNNIITRENWHRIIKEMKMDGLTVQGSHVVVDFKQWRLPYDFAYFLVGPRNKQWELPQSQNNVVVRIRKHLPMKDKSPAPLVGVLGTVATASSASIPQGIISHEELFNDVGDGEIWQNEHGMDFDLMVASLQKDNWKNELDHDLESNAQSSNQQNPFYLKHKPMYGSKQCTKSKMIAIYTVSAVIIIVFYQLFIAAPSLFVAHFISFAVHFVVVVLALPLASNIPSYCDNYFMRYEMKLTPYQLLIAPVFGTCALVGYIFTASIIYMTALTTIATILVFNVAIVSFWWVPKKADDGNETQSPDTGRHGSEIVLPEKGAVKNIVRRLSMCAQGRRASLQLPQGITGTDASGSMDVDDKVKSFDLPDIFYNDECFSEFMGHLAKDFSTEYLLCFVEIMQFKYLMKKRFDIVDAEALAGTDVEFDIEYPLHGVAPLSEINKNGFKQDLAEYKANDDPSGIMGESKAVVLKIYKKYLETGAEYKIKLLEETKKTLDNLLKNEAFFMQLNASAEQVFCIYDETVGEVFSVLNAFPTFQTACDSLNI